MTPILYDEPPRRLSQMLNQARGNYPKNDEVVDYYHYSAEKGDANAVLSLAMLYYYGARGVEQDLPKAAEYFHRALDLGANTAAANLGHIYANGLGVKKNVETAIKFFKEAVHEGNPAAQNGMGYMYLHGYGVEQNTKIAMKMFKAAAQQGHTEAFYNLGVIHMGATGQEPDYTAAAQHFQVAAQRGHTLAMHKSGLMYMHGIGKEHSCETAVEYFKSAAERGPWIHDMWQAFKHFKRGNYDLAFSLYMSMAEQGYEVAQHNAAWMIDNGYGFGDENHGEVSIALYKNAAKQGNVEANLKIGDFFYYGRGGVKVDYSRAIAHYRQASQRQNAQAMFNLGIMQEHGIGLPQDFYLAKRWYDMSASANPDSKIPVTLALWKLQIHQYMVQMSLRWKRYSSRHQKIDEEETVTQVEEVVEVPAVDVEPLERNWTEVIGEDNALLIGLTFTLALLLYLRMQRRLHTD